MSYSVYLQVFKAGKPSFADFDSVLTILGRYGSVDRVENRLEFEPNGDNLCEIGFLGGDEESGIDSIGFDRPVSGGRLAELVFELLGVPGMCYFELDCTYVLARTDVSAELPEELLELCETGGVTIINSPHDVPL